MWIGSVPESIKVSQVGLSPGGWWAQWAFTSRLGGVSHVPYAELNLADHVGDDQAAVEANRAIVVQQFSTSAPELALIRAAHGSAVARAEDHAPGEPIEGVDGVVASTPNIAVMALAADCVPILLADVASGVVAAAHCGYRGLTVGIVAATVRAMINDGGIAERISAIVGPAICGLCYSVSEERADEVASAVPAARSRAANGGPSLDVRAGAITQLESMGVRVRVVGGCTFEDPNLFSFRRDGLTGRQAGAIVLRAA